MTFPEAAAVYLVNVAKVGDINRTFFQQRGFGEKHRISNGRNILSPGQECPRTHRQFGHTLSMNTTSYVRYDNEYFLYDKVFDEVHRQGGLSGYAHIDRGLFSVHRDMSMNIPRGKIDFGEILNVFSEIQ